MSCLPIEGWFDCGNSETLLETNRYLLGRRASPVTIEGSVVVPPVSIDPTAEIRGSILGPYVSVAAGAEIRSSIIRNSIVGGSAVVENAALEASLVGANAVVRDRCRRLNVGDSSEIDWE